jgi:hypothetical protein
MKRNKLYVVFHTGLVDMVASCTIVQATDANGAQSIVLGDPAYDTVEITGIQEVSGVRFRDSVLPED